MWFDEAASFSRPRVNEYGERQEGSLPWRVRAYSISSILIKNIFAQSFNLHKNHPSGTNMDVCLLQKLRSILNDVTTIHKMATFCFECENWMWKMLMVSLFIV